MSARENLLIESRQALWNLRAFALQATTLPLPATLAYRKAAKEMFNQAKSSRFQAKFRMYCAYSCLLGLIPLAIALLFVLLQYTCLQKWWTVPLGISIGFILLAAIIHMKQEDVPVLEKLFPPEQLKVLQLDPNKQYFDQIQDEFPWLEQRSNTQG